MIQGLDFNNPEFVKQLSLCFDQVKDKITGIDYSKNKIQSLAGFQNLRKYFKNCVNLNFDGNFISDFNELNHIMVWILFFFKRIRTWNTTQV
jgi:hypothetical protein